MKEGMKIQDLVVQNKICFDFIKFIKFANYFIKVLYGFWHFNDVYCGVGETKDFRPVAACQNREQLCIQLHY